MALDGLIRNFVFVEQDGIVQSRGFEMVDVPKGITIPIPAIKECVVLKHVIVRSKTPTNITICFDGKPIGAMFELETFRGNDGFFWQSCFINRINIFMNSVTIHSDGSDAKVAITLSTSTEENRRPCFYLTKSDKKTQIIPSDAYKYAEYIAVPHDVPALYVTINGMVTKVTREALQFLWKKDSQQSFVPILTSPPRTESLVVTMGERAGPMKCCIQ